MHLDYQDIIEKYKSYDITIDEAKVKKAIEFAVKYHGTQQRESGDLYYHHPLEVAEIIAEMRLDTDSIVTAILHDTMLNLEQSLYPSPIRVSIFYQDHILSTRFSL